MRAVLAAQIAIDPNPPHLQVFLAVVECGSMAKAAAQLSVTKPAVSEIIAGFESTFGARLFDRTPRGIETTLYGRVLLDRTLTVLDELKQGAKDIAFLADPTVGELRIGCPESNASAGDQRICGGDAPLRAPGQRQDF